MEGREEKCTQAISQLKQNERLRLHGEDQAGIPESVFRIE